MFKNCSTNFVGAISASKLWQGSRRKTNKLEDAELEKQIRLLNKPTIKIVKAIVFYLKWSLYLSVSWDIIILFDNITFKKKKKRQIDHWSCPKFAKLYLNFAGDLLPHKSFIDHYK